ncbi:MAG: prohibitin family protein [Ignavibacteriales bacterium]|nr:prohibitin family protein [Ignavibacteriales bacterium]
MLFLLFTAVAFVALINWASARKKFKREHNEAFKTPSTVSGLVGFAALVLAFTQCVTVVPAGHVGVVNFFGTVSSQTLKAGINVVNPLATIIKFSIKTQEDKEELEVPTKEGLTVRLEASILYHLDPEMASEVYKTIGEDYKEIILLPNFRSIVRGVTAMYEAKALYTSARESLSALITVDVAKLVAKRGIIVESIPLRRLILPEKLSASIEEKLQTEQSSQRMQFVLLKETQEADRKRIEAQGIADFQKIVATGISEQLLRWKGIEATLKIAESPNAKVIVIGSGKDGLPIILGQQ